MRFLKDQFPMAGASFVIRRLVSDFVDKLSAPITDKQVAALASELEKESAL